MFSMYLFLQPLQDLFMSIAPYLLVFNAHFAFKNSIHVFEEMKTLSLKNSSSDNSLKLW